MRPIVVDMQAFGPFARRQVIDFTLLGEKNFFLIHGPTGSGKTSILDAMCFALFGDSSGGERDGQQMRSHHADATTLTQVRFEFALGDRRFGVLRIPEQERPARRGGGAATQPQKAEIHRLDIGADGATREVPLASGWRKVTDEVVRLLGFESRQFRQVIMLPQGQFFDFLKSSSQEREKILQALFGTEVYRRIAERLSLQAKEVEDEAKGSSTERNTLLRQAGVPDIEALNEHLAALAAQVAAAGVAQSEAREAEGLAAEKLLIARQLADRFDEFDKAGAALQKLKDEEEQKSLIQLAVKRARAALSVAPYVTAAEKAMAKEAEATRYLAQLRAQETLQVAESVKADAAVLAARQRDPELDELNRQLIRLDTFRSKVLLLQTAREQQASADALVKRAEAEHGASEKSRKGTADQQEALVGELQAQQLLAAKLEGLKARASLLEVQSNRASALARVQRDITSARIDQERQAKALDSARRAELLARAESDATHQAWMRGQAARLAAGLVVDQACPVCGSSHHPAPAHRIASGEIVHDDALEAVEGALKKAVELHNSVRLRHDEALRQTQSLQTRIEELQADLVNVTDSALELGQTLASTRAELKASEAATVGLAAVQARLEAASTAHGLAREAAVQAASRLASARASLQKCQAVVSEREKELPPELASPDRLDKARAAVAEQLAGLRKVKDDAAAAASSAQQGVAMARARVASTEQALVNLSGDRDAAIRTRDELLTATGFDGLKAFEDARMPEEKLSAAEEDLKRFDADFSAARQRLARAAGEVSNRDRPDVAALAAALEQARAAHLAASNAVRDLLAAQRTSTGLADQLREQAAGYERLLARYAIVKRVSDLANGVGGQRMSFQRYVLSTLLEEVLAATTQRLQVMSRGRYELRRVSATGDRRAAAGLDLEAFDQYTGSVRSVTTLSGGESFLTSLALALGLSDVVQSYSGGIRLDAIFVDEGFGTLDTEALDFAIRALKDLQQSGRMVGIISHVTELREWIDARLEVKAGATGSVAEFIV